MKGVKIFGLVFCAVCSAFSQPNILFITVDDMSCDSIGVFGCKVPDTTPNLDRFAGQGMHFNNAHVQVDNCMPSRNVMQSGRYPHNNGVEGFYQVKNPDYKILPDLLKENGYFVGIKGKVSHSKPYHPCEWDIVLEPESKGDQRKAESFYKLTRQGWAKFPAGDQRRKADRARHGLQGIQRECRGWPPSDAQRSDHAVFLYLQSVGGGLSARTFPTIGNIVTG